MKGSILGKFGIAEDDLKYTGLLSINTDDFSVLELFDCNLDAIPKVLYGYGNDGFLLTFIDCQFNGKETSMPGTTLLRVAVRFIVRGKVFFSSTNANIDRFNFKSKEITSWMNAQNVNLKFDKAQAELQTVDVSSEEIKLKSKGTWNFIHSVEYKNNPNNLEYSFVKQTICEYKSPDQIGLFQVLERISTLANLFVVLRHSSVGIFNVNLFCADCRFELHFGDRNPINKAHYNSHQYAISSNDLNLSVIINYVEELEEKRNDLLGSLSEMFRNAGGYPTESEFSLIIHAFEAYYPLTSQIQSHGLNHNLKKYLDIIKKDDSIDKETRQKMLTTLGTLKYLSLKEKLKNSVSEFRKTVDIDDHLKIGDISTFCKKIREIRTGITHRGKIDYPLSEVFKCTRKLRIILFYMFLKESKSAKINLNELFERKKGWIYGFF